jgi:hypothetical protein
MSFWFNSTSAVPTFFHNLEGLPDLNDDTILSNAMGEQVAFDRDDEPTNSAMG